MAIRQGHPPACHFPLIPFLFIGDLLFGSLFFVTGQCILWLASLSICRLTIHYIDGIFFNSLFNLLAVMMVYKYWDSITKEDWEFSVQDEPSYTIKAGPHKPDELSMISNSNHKFL